MTFEKNKKNELENYMDGFYDCLNIFRNKWAELCLEDYVPGYGFSDSDEVEFLGNLVDKAKSKIKEKETEYKELIINKEKKGGQKLKV